VVARSVEAPVDEESPDVAAGATIEGSGDDGAPEEAAPQED
jgi:hypothetical protein